MKNIFRTQMIGSDKLSYETLKNHSFSELYRAESDDGNVLYDVPLPLYVDAHPRCLTGGLDSSEASMQSESSCCPIAGGTVLPITSLEPKPQIYLPSPCTSPQESQDHPYRRANKYIHL